MMTGTSSKDQKQGNTEKQIGPIPITPDQKIACDQLLQLYSAQITAHATYCITIFLSMFGLIVAYMLQPKNTWFGSLISYLLGLNPHLIGLVIVIIVGLSPFIPLSLAIFYFLGRLIVYNLRSMILLNFLGIYRIDNHSTRLFNKIQDLGSRTEGMAIIVEDELKARIFGSDNDSKYSADLKGLKKKLVKFSFMVRRQKDYLPKSKEARKKSNPLP
ncbi:MAG: hypothetical protein JRN15_06710 [Nitrososphaerota archaeon]|nr:hypothetical protein [Nitrososphaerota archaeon]